MKNIIYRFLIIAVLTPMLVCSTDFCIKEAKAADQPCHEQGHDQNNQDGTSGDSLMFMTDCLNIDLQKADDNTAYQAPDFQIDKVLYGWAVLNSLPELTPIGAHLIRGPPAWTQTAKTRPPLILTTQRYRL